MPRLEEVRNDLKNGRLGLEQIQRRHPFVVASLISEWDTHLDDYPSLPSDKDLLEVVTLSVRVKAEELLAQHSPQNAGHPGFFTTAALNLALINRQRGAEVVRGGVNV